MRAPILQKLDKDFQQNKKQFRSFISQQEKKLGEKDFPRVAEVEKKVWEEVECLSCANCCKVMSPTFTREDIERISAFLGMTPARFKRKWLYFDKKSRDWMNVSQPCQFLDLATNKCNIYDIRPADCAGFPHLSKTPFSDYFYIHKQNIEYCPATYSMIEKMKNLLKEKPLLNIE